MFENDDEKVLKVRENGCKGTREGKGREEKREQSNEST